MAQVYALVGTFEGCAGDLGLTVADFSAFEKVRSAIYKLAAQANPKVVVLNNAPAAFLAQASELIQKDANLPMIGTKAEWLRHDHEDIKTLAFYGEIATGRFAVVENGKRLEKTTTLANNNVQFPRRLTAVTSPHYLAQWGSDKVAQDQAQFDALLKEGLAMAPRVLIEEDIASLPEVNVFAYLTGADAKNKKHAVTAVAAARSSGAPLPEEVIAPCKKIGEIIIKTFAYHTGFAACSLRIKQKTEAEKKKDDDDGLAFKVLLFSVELNPNVLEASRSTIPDLAGLVEQAGGVASWVACQGVLALELHRIAQPKTKVSFDNDQCGYFVRAACDIKKDEVIMDDEGMTFTVVTRPHVMANWTEEDKVVFSRFAWPLESDSHVYVTWEESPKRWRPINHSCDPNCIYGANNSLNQIAARDIKEGDELTLDYATFCDFSMKPFKCFCGSAKCRGDNIMPTQAALEQYGNNAWHRRMPNTAAGKV